MWYDDRLKWDPAHHDDIKEFVAYPLNPREYEMDNNLWLPSMYTTNTIVSEEDSTEVGSARVRHDGRVWHSVPGTLELSCRFKNLVNFPRDVRRCEPRTSANKSTVNSATHSLPLVVTDPLVPHGSRQLDTR